MKKRIAYNDFTKFKLKTSNILRKNIFDSSLKSSRQIPLSHLKTNYFLNKLKNSNSNLPNKNKKKYILHKKNVFKWKSSGDLFFSKTVFNITLYKIDYVKAGYTLNSESEQNKKFKIIILNSLKQKFATLANFKKNLKIIVILNSSFKSCGEKFKDNSGLMVWDSYYSKRKLNQGFLLLLEQNFSKTGFDLLLNQEKKTNLKFLFSFFFKY